MNCKICAESIEGVAALPGFEGRSERYFRCPGCASLVLHPLPTPERLNAHFLDADTVRFLVASGIAREAYFGRRLDLIEPARLGSSAARLFEIGCGCGSLLKAASARGWTVEACELSPKLAEHARRSVPGAAIHEQDILECGFIERRVFQAVVALDVLEHVMAPRRMLEIARALLAPGGLLLVQTPNALSLRSRIERGRWSMLIPEYHFHLLSAKALSGLIEATGFSTRLLQTVSGSGEERGLARPINDAKERLLSVLRLGNALLLLAVARHAGTGSG